MKNNKTFKESIISRLKELQRWYPNSSIFHECPSIDWEEDNNYGEWIKLEDVEGLIKELGQVENQPNQCIHSNNDTINELLSLKETDVELRTVIKILSMRGIPKQIDREFPIKITSNVNLLLGMYKYCLEMETKESCIRTVEEVD